MSSSWSVEMMAEHHRPPLPPFHSLTLSLVSLQNQSSAVGGFLPLLMGGGLFSARMPPAATPSPPLLADPVASLLSVNMESPTVLIRSHNVHCHFEIEELFIVFVLCQQLPPHSVPRAHEAPPSQNGAVSEGSSSPELHSPLNGKDAGNQMRSGRSQGYQSDDYKFLMLGSIFHSLLCSSWREQRPAESGQVDGHDVPHPEGPGRQQSTSCTPGRLRSGDQAETG